MEQLGQNPATRSGGGRSVVAFTAIMVLGLTLVLSPLIVWLWPSKKEAVATYRPTVEVQDEAGVLDSTALSDKLKNLEFRKQVHLAVLTVPGEDVSNLDDAVLEYARSHASDTDVPWVSTSNPKYWSDGLVILAVAPDSRKVGCYFGEDVKVMSSQEDDIQEAAKSQFREKDWDGGLVSMGKKSTKYVGKPRSDLRAFLLQVSFPVAGIGAAGIGVYLWRGLMARRRAGEALRHYTQVAHDYRATERHAQRIPTEEPHGAQVMARYRWFRDEYENLTRSWQDFGSPRHPVVRSLHAPQGDRLAKTIGRAGHARRRRRQHRNLPQPGPWLGAGLVQRAGAGPGGPPGAPHPVPQDRLLRQAAGQHDGYAGEGSLVS